MAPWAGLAAPVQAKAAKTTTSSKTTAGTHSTTGTVKSVSTTALVVARSGKNNTDMTFVLDPSTHREGAIDVGSSVSVRYREDGQSNHATAVTARPAKH
jgi:hypothetical protein